MGQLTKEISISADNKPGSLAKVTGCLKESQVSIQACCARGEGNRATFLFVTENNSKAVDALKKAGFSPSERDVVTCTLQHRVGSLAEATQKISQAGIDIDHCYVTAMGSNSLAVFATKDNRKAVDLLP